MNFRHLKEIWDGFTFGAQRSLLPIFSTASEVGYGAVIAAMAAFAIIREGILNPGMNALAASAISTSTIADKATQILVDQFNYLRSNAVEPLSKFLDYITCVGALLPARPH